MPTGPHASSTPQTEGQQRKDQGQDHHDHQNLWSQDRVAGGSQFWRRQDTGVAIAQDGQKADDAQKQRGVSAEPPIADAKFLLGQWFGLPLAIVIIIGIVWGRF